MIVVDLGCAEHAGEASIGPLIERFQPDVLYGFDPSPELARIVDGSDFYIEDTYVVLQQKAAWVYDGFIGFRQQGLRSRVGEEQGPMAVPCFDFSLWLKKVVGFDSGAIVKMDIEGAEKPVLERMIETGADQLVELLLIEWHDQREFVEPFDRRDLISRLHCPVERWH